MDPNANLQEQEHIIKRQGAVTHSELASADARRLRELREALTNWLTSGGFEPDWSKARRARKYYRK